jgi:creatinine amidohydrolase/Fe(II)-dependent formamide hydrolase-like protein
MMLAIAPERVHLERMQWQDAPEAERNVFVRPAVLSPDPASGLDYCPTGATGDPTRATAAKGEAVLAEITRELVAGLRALWPEAIG